MTDSFVSLSFTHAVKDGAEFLWSCKARRFNSSAQSLGKETFLIRDDNCSSSFSERSDISEHLIVLDFFRATIIDIMESGENKNPTLETLKKVAKALDISVDDLI